MLKHALSFVVSSLILIAPLCQAQDDGNTQAETEEEAFVSTKFAIYFWLKSAYQRLDKPLPDYYYMNNGKPVPIRRAPGRRTRFFEYYGTNPIMFYLKQEGADGNIQYKPVAKGTLSPGQSKVVFISFDAMKEDTDGVRHMIPTDSSPHNLPDNSARFYNFSDEQLVIRFGDSDATIEPKKSKFVKLSGINNYTIQLKIARATGEGFELIYNNTLSVVKGRRYIYVAYPTDKEKGVWDVRSLGNLGPAKEEKAAKKAAKDAPKQEQGFKPPKY